MAGRKVCHRVQLCEPVRHPARRRTDPEISGGSGLPINKFGGARMLRVHPASRADIRHKAIRYDKGPEHE